MSEQDDDLELQALQRELDDAFATTRPRRGFEDELWLQIQAKRPFWARLRDVVAGWFGDIRKLPAIPMAAVAAVLVVAIGIGIVANGGAGRLGGGGASSLSGAPAQDATKRYSGEYSAGAFGPLPTLQGQQLEGGIGPALAYDGPAYVNFTGKLNVSITSAPVFRYQEPTSGGADQFASGLGAALIDRPAGFLGSYKASTYTLKVRGTVQSPPSTPAYFIFANLAMPAVDAAGASSQDLAIIFLAQHSLLPQWTYTVSVNSAGDPIRVVYERLFDVPGYGKAHLVDSNGVRYGLEVDLSGGRPVLASGLLPVTVDSADYRIISSEQAIREAVTPPTRGPVSASPLPTVNLTQAELVYVLVPAGGHSFFEPAFLFSGAFKLNGATMVKRILVPAIDPSQRVP